MLVDLSHVSSKTMHDALKTSTSPCIFSHSSARSVANVTRNVPDDVLKAVKGNEGLVMVNFGSYFIKQDYENLGVDVWDVVEHFNHIREVAGVDSVGVGSDFSGVNALPKGLEDVST